MSHDPTLETLQYYRDTKSDKFGWVKVPIRVVEDACLALESRRNVINKLRCSLGLQEDDRSSAAPLDKGGE